MNTHDVSPPSQRSSILGWLGLGRGNESMLDALVSPVGISSDASNRARLASIDAISRFLAAHNLEVSSFTLAIAHDYLTGEDQRVARFIDRQIQLRAPITVGWLEGIQHNPDLDDDRSVLSALMVKLQDNLEAFGQTTTAARAAASDYGSALEFQVDEIKRIDVTGAAIADLANLAKTMLDRTRELEVEMSRSDQQTRTLQRSLDQARLTAERDHLTGLPNRRAFEARLASEYVAAQESHEPLCIAFCDIDNFKAINDTHGHEAGDRILKAVAKNLARISNDKCHVARHGGEEFAVLIRGMSVHQCWELLDEMRIQQAERRLINRATEMPFGKVTFSAGLAEIFAFFDPRVALRAADQALYQAKEEGRNRVLVAQHPPEKQLESA